MTQQLVGYKLLDENDEVVEQWGGALNVRPDQPTKIRLPNGDDVHAPVLGESYQGYHLEEWWMDEPPPPDPLVPEEISDRQFFQMLAISGVITEQEALDAVRVGAIPAALQTLINSLPAEQKFATEMLVSGAVVFHRTHEVVGQLGTGMGWTSEQIDELWTQASQL